MQCPGRSLGLDRRVLPRRERPLDPGDVVPRVVLPADAGVNSPSPSGYGTPCSFESLGAGAEGAPATPVSPLVDDVQQGRRLPTLDLATNLR